MAETRRAADATVGAERDRVRPNHIFLHDGGARPNPTGNHLLQLDHICFRFRNGGKSDADVIAISVNRLVVEQLPDVPVYQDARAISPAQSIGAKDSWEYISHGWDRTDDPIEPNLADEILAANRLNYWVYGYIDYFNFVGGRERKKFCGWLNAYGLATDPLNSSLILGGPKAYTD